MNDGHIQQKDLVVWIETDSLRKLGLRRRIIFSRDGNLCLRCMEVRHAGALLLECIEGPFRCRDVPESQRCFRQGNGIIERVRQKFHHLLPPRDRGIGALALKDIGD